MQIKHRMQSIKDNQKPVFFYQHSIKTNRTDQESNPVESSMTSNVNTASRYVFLTTNALQVNPHGCDHSPSYLSPLPQIFALPPLPNPHLPHDHPSLYSWSSFSVLTVTLLCIHGHPSLHSWSPFPTPMFTLFYIEGHPSLHSWSTFSALMVTLLCTHGHPSLHSWSPFSALMVSLLCTHGHPSLHSWSPFSALMVTLLCTHGQPSLHS